MGKWQKALALTAGFLVLAGAGFGQGVRGNLFINGAAFFPNNGSIQDKFGQGIGITLSFQRHFTASFEWKYARLKVDSTEGGLMNSELAYTPLVLSIAYHPLPESRFSPYLFLGGGLFLIQLRPGARLTPEEAEIRTQKVKNGFGLHGGLGATFRLASRFFLYVEGLTLWRKANVETLFFDSRPARSFSADFSAFSVLVGLKLFY